MNRHPVLIAGVLLGMFAVIGSGLVAFTHESTRDRIAANERAAMLRSLHSMIPAERVDNDMTADVLQVSEPALLGARQTTIYRARREGKPIAAIFTSVAPDGYSGPIKLLVAVNTDGTVAGVRVVTHTETPGLGDRIEESRSDWVYSFDGRSLADPEPDRWAVKKDGGVFDQFTGATITPRAVINAVKNTLHYYQSERDNLFAPGRGAAAPEKGDS
jgi:electron transport complex protein RnfG